jgi:hypothetical protein
MTAALVANRATVRPHDQDIAAPTVADDTAFRVAVLISAERKPESLDVTRVFARANDILKQKTGEHMVQVDRVDVGRGSAASLAQDYANTAKPAPPDGVLVFSDDRESTTYGGYSLMFTLPAGGVNRFASPIAGPTFGFIAVVDFFHWYARCGYNSQLQRVSTRSRGGECHSQTGLTCVDNGKYWMCPDATKDPNADQDYFIGCDIVHEFVHPFGSAGDDDHYGTEQCTTRTHMSQADAGDRLLFQQNCGMCPDMFAKFRRAQPRGPS